VTLDQSQVAGEVRLAVDMGGTFTGVVALDSATG